MAQNNRIKSFLLELYNIDSKKIITFLLGCLLAIFIYWLFPSTCPEGARRTAAIIMLAAICWIFEIFPLYVTSLLIIIVLTFAVAIPSGKFPYTLFLSPFADPVIMLFFGGFTLAAAMRKYHLENYIARKILLRFNRSPYRLLLGTMLTTTFIGLWISNTATAVIMLAIIQPFLGNQNLDDNLKKSLVLAVPFAAGIGGTGTPIASPPNAIAIGMLEQKGIVLTFFQWMEICIPLVLLRILMASAVLFYFFPVRNKDMTWLVLKPEAIEGKGKVVGLIGIIIIGLFVTSSWSGIPEAIIALICAAVLTAGKLLDREDIKKLDWDILILMWGGLSLGLAMDKTGLGQWIIDLPILQLQGELLVILFCLLAFIFSSFISSTATAALLLPLALNIEGENKIILGITLTLASTLGLALPIASPPNALAYSTGMIHSRDMFKSGLTVDLLSLAIILAGFWFVIPAIVT